ncbi:c-type cytochrome [Caulobacter sp.]|uniref:c-type cytochrome n=1 Tax=Caulobacter sp. TaxID=78 RepID=UPI002B4A4212|nr:c-type cytochrome [Caulobacter sp.]HJV42612.1 c-type cytochrome [Caulobacter sp.]
MKNVFLLVSVIVPVLHAGSSAAAQANGQALFESRCGMCHGLTPAPGKMGPPLKGVVGRKLGAAAGYNYSDALKRSKTTWSTARLDAFLAAPGKAAPGTKMMVGVSAADQRAAIIAYLSSQK